MSLPKFSDNCNRHFPKWRPLRFENLLCGISLDRLPYKWKMATAIIFYYFFPNSPSKKGLRKPGFAWWNFFLVFQWMNEIKNAAIFKNGGCRCLRLSEMVFLESLTMKTYTKTPKWSRYVDLVKSYREKRIFRVGHWAPFLKMAFLEIWSRRKWHFWIPWPRISWKWTTTSPI